MPEIQMTQQEYEKRIDMIRLCGINRGPHDYVPLAWVSDKEKSTKYVDLFICKTCFTRVSSKTLFEHFPEAKV
jgi:hypothetical protein